MGKINVWTDSLTHFVESIYLPVIGHPIVTQTERSTEILGFKICLQAQSLRPVRAAAARCEQTEHQI